MLKKILFIVIVVFSINLFSSGVIVRQVVSSTEVLVEAWGVGKKPYDAEQDCKYNAVWHFITGGDQPLISNADEKVEFEKGANKHFQDKSNIDQYINHVSTDWLELRTKKIKGKKKKKGLKLITVNRKKIEDKLVADGVITSKADLEDIMGMPTIMVIPKGDDIIALLKDKNNTKAAATAKETLADKQYEVTIPEAKLANDIMAGAIKSTSETSEIDIVAALASSIGSDIYIKFDIDWEGNKAIIVLEAFETTTARMLGTTTGYGMGTSVKAVDIDLAMKDAIQKVLNQITNYWKKDIAKGKQYKLTFNISTEFEKGEFKDIKKAIKKLLKSDSFNDKKRTISTKQTIEYIVWADPKLDAEDIEEIVEDEVGDELDFASVDILNATRKMLIFEIVPE